MTTTDTLDRKAIASARRYMGSLAWPTVILGLLLPMAYVAVVASGVAGGIPLWTAVAAVASLTYLSYTVLHESVHGSITGNDASLRWLNKSLGYLAAWITMIPLTAHKYEHMAHHRSTNDPVKDPDYHVAEMRASFFAPAFAVARAWISQFRFYARNRWQDAPSREKLALCVEVGAALLPRLAVIAAGYWVEGLAMFVVAWLLGAIALLYLFAYLVHRPHDRVGRYVDTSTVLLPGPLNRLVTWLWMFQNYHSVHHLFPRVPFYRYADLFAEIEDTMAAQDAPVLRITATGLKSRDLRPAS